MTRFAIQTSTNVFAELGTFTVGMALTALSAARLSDPDAHLLAKTPSDEMFSLFE